MSTIASGRAVNGARWELDIHGHTSDLVTIARITDLRGHRYGGGAGGPATYPDRRLNAAAGQSPESDTSYWIGRVATDVAAVIIQLSDGTREDLPLYGDPADLGARVAVLVYPCHLDIHRVDLLDATGSALTDERSAETPLE